MALLQSCCCWQSVRTGSFASAYYSLCYHVMSLLVMTPFLLQEREYLQGNASKPSGKSIIEKGTISHVSMAFSLSMVCISCLGLMTSCLLLCGLYKNIACLLVPWLTSISLTIVVDISHSFYLFVEETMKWNPMTAMIYTLDFFSIALNVYAMVCVISQYQEYQAGRGRADNDANQAQRLPAVQFNARPTATSCLSTRHEATYHVTKASPTQSPTGGSRSPVFSPRDLAPVYSNGNINNINNINNNKMAPRRHVKFPDFDGPTTHRQRLESHIDECEVDVVIQQEGKHLAVVDTAPLLEKTKTPRSPPRAK